MSRLGHGQAEVDEMELWVIAAILDSHAPRQADPFAPDPTGDGVPMTEEDFQRQSMELIRQRLAAAEASGQWPGSPSEPGVAPSIPV